MREYIHNQRPVLYAGVHQAQDWIVWRPDNAQVDDGNHAEFDQYVSASDVIFTTHGTDVIVRWQGSPVDVYIDSPGGLLQTARIFPVIESQSGSSQNHAQTGEAGWQYSTVIHSTRAQEYSIRLSVNEGFWLDSITVLDRTFENVFPLAAGAAIAVGMTLWVVASALRARRKQV
jgi:hypothetical protein